MQTARWRICRGQVHAVECVGVSFCRSQRKEGVPSIRGWVGLVDDNAAYSQVVSDSGVAGKGGGELSIAKKGGRDFINCDLDDVGERCRGGAFSLGVPIIWIGDAQ